jgi:hypothetical protein
MIQSKVTTSMTTYPTHVLSELAAGHDGPSIPRAKLAYFQERLRGRVFDFILSKFAEQETNGLNQAKLSRRINKDPKVVHRWLSAPSNLTLDSVSDMLIGIAAEELDLSSSPLSDRASVNYSHIDNLAAFVSQDDTRASAKNTMFDGLQGGDRKAANFAESIDQKMDKKSALCG